MSSSFFEGMKESFDKYTVAHTPLSGNICQDENCRGEVAKKVVSIYRGEFNYSIPTCQKCGRPYFLAKNVDVVGAREFSALMNTPFTI